MPHLPHRHDAAATLRPQTTGSGDALFKVERKSPTHSLHAWEGCSIFLHTFILARRWLGLWQHAPLLCDSRHGQTGLVVLPDLVPLHHLLLLRCFPGSMGLLAGDEWYYWNCLVAEYGEKGHPPGWMDGVPPLSHAILCLQLFSTYQGKGLYPYLSTGDEAKPRSVLLHPSLSFRSGMAAPFRQAEWAARKKADSGIRVRPIIKREVCTGGWCWPHEL